MKKIFEKWFCKHKWKSHDKTRIKVHNGRGQIVKDFDREILICQECGKIKKIEY